MIIQTELTVESIFGSLSKIDIIIELLTSETLIHSETTTQSSHGSIADFLSGGDET